MAEKMKVAEQAKYRAELYGAASEAFQSKGYTTETISDGMLVHLGEGQYSKVKILFATLRSLTLTMSEKFMLRRWQMRQSAQRRLV